ncbi:GntR family transcriptional regulator [Nocardioides daejeonensis]|uniref:GntR family transcriptional regulator n=1 Tax=Nocardioides daejeonensis TaxID=1046556 RepID=UPI000D748BE9|nr:GntR family transcriptional regulator [Nocardioides daejeonensis]
MAKSDRTNGFRRPPTAQEAVATELRRAIISGELSPGTQILQDKVAEQFGVSRVPVREALKMLEGEGQISYEPHRGYFVTELDIAELIEVYHIRNVLEAEAVRHAIPQMTPEDDERLEAALLDTEEANKFDDIVMLTAANRRFHFAMIEPCGMSRLVRIIRQLWDSTDPYRSVYFVAREHREKVDNEHRAILKAVLARETEQVVALLAEHRAGTVTSLRLMLEKDQETAET